MKKLISINTLVILIGIFGLAAGAYLMIKSDETVKAYLGIFTGIVLVGTGWFNNWKQNKLDS